MKSLLMMKPSVFALPLVLITVLAAPRLEACTVRSIDFEPKRPTSKEEIYVLLDGVVTLSDDVEVLRVRTTPAKVEVILNCGNPPLSGFMRWQERVYIGRLPAGTYAVTTGPSSPASTTLVVRDEPFGVGPTSGRAGTKVLLDGLAVIDDMVVRFGDIVVPFVPVAVDRWHPRQAVVTAPPHGPGFVDVTVTYRSGETLTFRDAFRYVSSDHEIEYERVLFPVVYAGPGANGAEWDTEIIVRNDAPVPVETQPLFRSFILPVYTAIPPGERVPFPSAAIAGGSFLYVPRGLEKHLAYSAHAIDRSRSTKDRGTEIPVIRASDTSSVLRIVNVPLGPDFRAMLRVYDFDSAERDLSVTLRRPGAPSISTRVTLRGAIQCVTEPCLQPGPTWAAVDLATIAGSTSGVFDITIEQFFESPRLWGFVSVTNNETQFVTTYSPQHRTGSE